MALRLRRRLGSFLGAARLPQARLALHRLRSSPRWLTILNYHRVAPRDTCADTDDGVLDATPESFESQLRMLHRHFTPITLGQLMAHLEGEPLPDNPALVTFDDGYRDNVDVALPLLQRHGLTATFFIATEYIEERRMFWWDRISWIVKHARRPRFTLEGPEALRVDLNDGANATRRLHRIVKTHRGLDVGAFLEALARGADAPWNSDVEAALAERNLMTWKDVRTLRQAGMDVGSHTRTHRVLQTVPADQLEGELVGSRTDLERVLGEPIHAIAYPVGYPLANDPQLRARVAAAGYRMGFSYGTGRQDLRRLDPFDIARFALEPWYSRADLLAQIAFPVLRL